MIFNIPVGAVKKVFITLQGATDEKITWTGKTTGEVTLDAFGQKSAVEMKAGVYTFTGQVSGYSTTLTVDRDLTVKVHPVGALFWFGNGDTEGDTLWGRCGGFAGGTAYRPSGSNISKNADFTYDQTGNQFYAHYSKKLSDWASANAEVHMVNEINIENYTSLKVTGSMSGGSIYSTNALSTAFQIVGQSTTLGEGTAITPAKYFIYRNKIQPQGSGTVSGEVTIKAIWLE